MTGNVENEMNEWNGTLTGKKMRIKWLICNGQTFQRVTPHKTSDKRMECKLNGDETNFESMRRHLRYLIDRRSNIHGLEVCASSYPFDSTKLDGESDPFAADSNVIQSTPPTTKQDAMITEPRSLSRSSSRSDHLRRSKDKTSERWQTQIEAKNLQVK